MGFKIGVLIVMLFLFIPIAISQGTPTYQNQSGEDCEYTNEGRADFDFIDGELDFNTFGKSLSSSRATPIIDDLDNNSISELIIISDDTVLIFQNKELDIIASFDFGDSPSDVSNILAFDIDGDGQKEIIFMVEGISDNQLKIINFSESEGLQLQREFKVFAGALPVHPMIACRAVNECIGSVTS